MIAIGSSKVVRLSFTSDIWCRELPTKWAEDLVDRAQLRNSIERVLRDAGFDDIAALTVEQTIEFPSVLDYVRFQLLATPMAAMSRSLLRIHRPHLIDDPAGQRSSTLA